LGRSSVGGALPFSNGPRVHDKAAGKPEGLVALTAAPQSAQPQRFEKKVGIVGLGRMGSKIAQHLFDMHVPVSVVYDKNEKLTHQISSELRCLRAQKLAEVTASAEVVLVLVPDDEAVDAVFAQSGDSVLLGANNGIFVDCSTASPRLHVDVEGRVAHHGGNFIEGSILGSPPQAHDGSLSIILGGEKPVIDKLAPLWRLMSRTQVYVGELPKAAEVRALVNMVANINTAGLAEGLALGSALGLNLDELREIFARTGAASRVLLSDGEDMQKREHTTFFAASNARRDAAIAVHLAHDHELQLPLAEATKRQYDMLCEVGLGHIDKSGVSELTFAERRKRYVQDSEKIPAGTPK
jgi:3-hydroxyisobutyrate dehydrogenase